MDLVAERKEKQAALDKHKEQMLLLSGYIACIDKQLEEQAEPPKEIT